ncbi:MAG: glycosyltransferase [Elusimicrobiales bacterium]|nr:glycosyltransferase [Elusimicrobiales bacterium]
MKILHITESNGFSGGVNQAILIANEFNKKDIQSFFASPSNSILRERISNLYTTFDFNPRGDFDFKTILNLKKIFETYKFDVVIAHHPKAHNYSFWAKKISKHKPILIAFRRVSHPIPKNLFVKIRYLSKDTNVIIAVSKSIEKILIDYGINPQKIKVIYSGVNTSIFYKKEKDIKFKKSLGLHENDLVISHIGNFSKEKGQDITLKAAKILYEKGYDFKLIFAGINTNSLEMIKLIEDIGVPKHKTILLGLRKDVEKILNITDISVNSSIKGEALSGAIRESLACGVCVVANNISGNNEIVVNGINGFLFEKGNYAEMAEKIENLIKNYDLRKKLSQNSTKTISEKFSIEKTANELLSIIDEFKVK